MHFPQMMKFDDLLVRLERHQIFPIVEWFFLQTSEVV